MNCALYLEQHGTPEMIVSWDIRELGLSTEAPEPALLIKIYSELKGYTAFLYKVLMDQERFDLWWNGDDHGWDIYLIERGGQDVLQFCQPAIAHYNFDSENWYNAALERKKAREWASLWLLGCPVVLRISDTGDDEDKTAILFDRFQIYHPCLSAKDTFLLYKYAKGEPRPMFEQMKFWGLVEA
jgi:hypothetical protein